MNKKYLLVVIMACLVLAGCGTFEIETQEYHTPTPTEEVSEVEIGEQEPVDSDNTLPKVPAENDLTEFRESLVSTLKSRDFSALPSLMGEEFIVGYWLSEGVMLTPDEAVEQLRLSLLPTDSSSPLAFTGNPADLPGFGGVEQALNFGPDVNVEGFIYSEGWGETGDTKTVLVIARGEDNSLYWFGMLVGYVSPDELLRQSGENHRAGIDSTITEVALQEPATEILAVIKIVPAGGLDQIFVSAETVISRMGDSTILTVNDLTPGMSIKVNGHAGFWADEITILP